MERIATASLLKSGVVNVVDVMLVSVTLVEVLVVVVWVFVVEVNVRVVTDVLVPVVDVWV